MTTSPLRELARQVRDLDRRVRGLGSGAQLSRSSIESGAIRAYEGDSQTMQIGRQWDGTYAPIVTNGPTPPTPSAPTIIDAVQGLVIEWDGSFAGGLIPVPMDFARVDAHVGATSDFIPDHSNRRASFVAPQGAQASVTLPDGTWYVKLVCWTLAGKVSPASDYGTGHALPPEAGGTDGIPPASSPDVTVIGGYEIILARWTPIVNPDPVTYDVHISTTSGFTPSPSTLVVSTSASQVTIKALPGDPPASPDDPDLRKFQYGVTYYVRVVARDGDGSADPGAQAGDTIYQLDGTNIAVESLTAANILSGSLTADLLSSTLLLSSEIWTALTGQRVGLTPDGYFAYKSDNSLMFKLPTDGTNALYDGELVVRGATVTGGMSIQSDENELTSDAALTLMRGIAAPQAAPQFADNYEKIQITTSGLTSAQKTGPLGTFDLAPGEVQFVEYQPLSGPYWVFHQVRPGGTRHWFFTTLGAPLALGGQYFTDDQYYQMSGITYLTTAASGKNGKYTLFYYTQDGRWWLSSPNGFDIYTPQNPSSIPRLGNNGSDIFIAEVQTNGTLIVRYYVPPGQGVSLPAPITTHTTTAGYSANVPLASVIYSAAGFDRGSARYMTAEYGVNYNIKLLSQSGANWFPGGSGNSWTSATKDAETFEAPAPNRRGTQWDGTAFWSFHADGYLYKHTGEQWDPSTGASTVWSQITFQDTDSGGTGTHETLPGPARTFTRKRRSRWRVTLPPPPDNGGSDDPNAVALYSAVGNSQPTNSAMKLQYSGLGPVDIVTLATATDSPPTTGTFPNANPAIIRSDDDALQIKGDGTGRFVNLSVGPAGGTAVPVSVNPPTIQTFSSSGTWTKPAGCKAVLVKVQGGAGAGGGVTAANTSGTNGKGGGGGGGGYSERLYQASDLANSIPVTVGGGGVGASGAGGGNGGATNFQHTTNLIGGGGGGGAVGNPSASAFGSSGGAGGTGSGGTYSVTGSSGLNSWGQGVLGASGNGGSSALGGGAAGITDAAGNKSIAGVAGGVWGGGGSGAYNSHNGTAQAAQAGGNGAPGLCIVICYF